MTRLVFSSAARYQDHPPPLLVFVFCLLLISELCLPPHTQKDSRRKLRRVVGSRGLAAVSPPSFSCGCSRWCLSSSLLTDRSAPLPAVDRPFFVLPISTQGGKPYARERRGASGVQRVFLLSGLISTSTTSQKKRPPWTSTLFVKVLAFPNRGGGRQGPSVPLVTTKDDHT